MAVSNKNGFTLIELVIGMAILAIAMMLMSVMFVSQGKQSLNPLHQLRASQFAEAILQQAASSSYDTIDNGQPLNDVQDFITVGFEPIFNYEGILGNNLPTQYNNYQVMIAVSEFLNTEVQQNMKRIDLTIKTPNDENIAFSVLKGRY